MEIITGQPAISRKNGKEHLIEWVKLLLSKGDIKNIMDPRLEQDFNKNSVWKAAEVAMACVSNISTKRPTMTNIMTDLKQCLVMEMARTSNSDVIESVELIEMMHVTTDSGPIAR